MKRKNLLIGSLLLLILFPIWAQKSEQLRVIHSDKLYLTKIQEEQVMRLEGKVHFFYGNTEFHSDRASIFNLQKIARLDGNVKVNNDSLSLFADSLTYYRIPDELNAGGKIYIEENKKGSAFRWFRSNYAIYNQKYNQITVWENVSAYDKEENASIFCGYAFWDRNEGYAYMIEKPRIITAQEDTLYVNADKMEYFEKERKLVATFNVQAQTHDYRTVSDFLLYFLKEDKAVFTGMPVFHSDYAKAEAGEFYLYFKERKLNRAELVDSCRVEFSEEAMGPRFNWVVADYIDIGFEEDRIRSFNAERAVKYHYVRQKTEKNDYFDNTATGDFLEVQFTPDNKLDYMKMKMNIKGIYKFQNKS